MDNNKKEVTITIKVDKRLSRELKKIARRKQMLFSAYIRRILLAEAEKQIRRGSVIE